jgi:predicted transcriptional regulator
MKKTLRIGIASYEEMKERTIAIAKGKHKVSKDEPKVWFTSIESFAKVLSEKNRVLLEVIGEAEGLTLTELAEKTGREKSNLSRTLKTMERYGLVNLERKNGNVIPHVGYSKISLDMPLYAGM